MVTSEKEKRELAKLGRMICLILNRSSMYRVDHPYVNEAVGQFFDVVSNILKSLTPVVFAMNLDQFFIDEEPLDPHINTKRILEHFKRNGIVSLSFERGLKKVEIKTFLRILYSPEKYSDVNSMKNALVKRQVNHVRINHVFFKKVTAEDEIIPHDAFKKLTPAFSPEDEGGTKKLLFDAVIENVVGEELEKTLSLENLVTNPSKFIDEFLGSTETSSSQEKEEHPEAVLVGKLKSFGQQLEREIPGKSNIELADVAEAVFGMKKRLVENLREKRLSGIAFAKEAEIIDVSNDLTDKVILKLVEEEYSASKGNYLQLARVLRRIIPDPDDLNRLLPKIKETLIGKGMTLTDYKDFALELKVDSDGEIAARALHKSAEKLGLEGPAVIEEIIQDTDNITELIYMAAEMRNSAGNEELLTQLTATYMEKLYRNARQDSRGTKKGKEHLPMFLSHLSSNILGGLKQRGLEKDVLARLEKRLNTRLETLVEKINRDWIEAHLESNTKKTDDLTVLQVLEQNCDEVGELKEILKAIRSKVNDQQIDQNDFRQIYQEIIRQRAERRKKEAEKKMPPGVLRSAGLLYYINKEVARARRYDIPFSALSLYVTMVRPETKGIGTGYGVHQALTDQIVWKLSLHIRESDILGLMDKDKIVVLLPMTDQKEGGKALRRISRVLNADPLRVGKNRYKVTVTVVLHTFNGRLETDTKAYVRTLMDKLENTVTRVKNIQCLM